MTVRWVVCYLPLGLGCARRKAPSGSDTAAPHHKNSPPHVCKLSCAAARSDRKKCLIDNVSAAVRLQKFTSPADQFALAILDKPQRFRTKLHKTNKDGPQARKDARDDKRTKLMQILGAILTKTKTPTCKYLHDIPGTCRRWVPIREHINIMFTKTRFASALVGFLIRSRCPALWSSPISAVQLHEER